MKPSEYWLAKLDEAAIGWLRWRIHAWGAQRGEAKMLLERVKEIEAALDKVKPDLERMAKDD